MIIGAASIWSFAHDKAQPRERGEKSLSPETSVYEYIIATGLSSSARILSIRFLPTVCSFLPAYFGSYINHIAPNSLFLRLLQVA